MWYNFLVWSHIFAYFNFYFILLVVKHPVYKLYKQNSKNHLLPTPLPTWLMTSFINGPKLKTQPTRKAMIPHEIFSIKISLLYRYTKNVPAHFFDKCSTTCNFKVQPCNTSAYFRFKQSLPFLNHIQFARCKSIKVKIWFVKNPTLIKVKLFSIFQTRLQQFFT